MISSKDKEGQLRAAEKKYHVRLANGRYLIREPYMAPGEFRQGTLPLATLMIGVVARILATAHRAAGGKAEVVLASSCRNLNME